MGLEPALPWVVCDEFLGAMGCDDGMLQVMRDIIGHDYDGAATRIMTTEGLAHVIPGWITKHVAALMLSLELVGEDICGAYFMAQAEAACAQLDHVPAERHSAWIVEALVRDNQEARLWPGIPSWAQAASPAAASGAQA